MAGRILLKRPHRKWSRNPNYSQFVSGGIPQFLVGMFFGLLFFGVGMCVVVAAMKTVLIPQPEIALGRWMLNGLMASVLCLSHTTIGLFFIRWAVCFPEWVTVDRKHGLVTKQTGVFWFRKVATASLPDFSEISIFTVTNKWQFGDGCEVALTGLQGKRFSIGRFSSFEVAREFGQEVSAFLGLPLH